MNRILSFCMGLAMLCIFSPAISAQDGYEIKGVVSDEVGPVIGATVMEQGTMNGTSTGLDGDFTLTVSSKDAVVEISCIGYRTVTFKASGVPSVITLEEDTLFLDDVVVIGYGTTKKRDITGSIVSVTKDDIELMMHGAFHHYEFAHAQRGIERANKTEVYDCFHVEQVDQQLHGKRGANFAYTGSREIYGVSFRFDLFDCNARHAVFGDHVSEFPIDGQGFFRHGGDNADSHKRLRSYDITFPSCGQYVSARRSKIF